MGHTGYITGFAAFIARIIISGNTIIISSTVSETGNSACFRSGRYGGQQCGWAGTGSPVDLITGHITLAIGRPGQGHLGSAWCSYKTGWSSRSRSISTWGTISRAVDGGMISVAANVIGSGAAIFSKAPVPF